MQFNYIIDQIGNKSWFKGNVIHREDGPAYEGVNGLKVWYFDGLLHRDNGPAYESGKHKAWYHHNERHRLDGPAIEFENGDCEWWFDGKRILVETQEEFEKYLKLKAFW